MTYTPDKPDPGPSPRLDAPIIQQDFQVYANIFKVNHTEINNVNQGDHEKVIFEKQASDPAEVINSAVVYAKDATSKIDTQPQLFVNVPEFLPTKNDTTEADNVAMQLTYNTVNITGPSQYQSFLVGGYLIYFGSITGNTTPNVKISVTVILVPAPTEIIIAIATPNTMTTGAPVRPFDVKTIVNTTLNDRFSINSFANDSGASIPYKFGWVAIARA